MSVLLPVDDCAVSAFIGPDDTATGALLRDLHRAWHAVVGALVDIERAYASLPAGARDRLMRCWTGGGSVSVPLCATTCLVVDRFVTTQAVLTGAGEDVVRQASGITATEQAAAAVLRAVLDEMPNTADPSGWLVARLHQLEHTEATP